MKGKKSDFLFFVLVFVFFFKGSAQFDYTKTFQVLALEDDSINGYYDLSVTVTLIDSSLSYFKHEVYNREDLINSYYLKREEKVGIEKIYKNRRLINYIVYSSGGIKREELFFYNNSRLKIQRIFNDSGGILMDREYYSNGNLWGEIRYKDGVKNGVERRYNKKNRLIMLYFYKNGILTKSKKIK